MLAPFDRETGKVRFPISYQGARMVAAAARNEPADGTDSLRASPRAVAA